MKLQIEIDLNDRVKNLEKILTFTRDIMVALYETCGALPVERFADTFSTRDDDDNVVLSESLPGRGASMAEVRVTFLPNADLRQPSYMGNVTEETVVFETLHKPDGSKERSHSIIGEEDETSH